MASLDDIVTVQKNGVVAVNALVQALNEFKTVYESFVGNKSFSGISDNTLVTSVSGRLVNLSVSVAAAGGTIHDSATVAAADTSNVICSIPSTTGVYSINFPFSDGLVVKPASSSTVSVSYSES
jgi:glycerol dehydrogenase-like iron-containing ADH family enzyme